MVIESIAESIYRTMRDDDTATVGLRALLGNTSSTPYNVYRVYLPESVDFSASGGADSFIVYRLISESVDNDFQGPAGRVQMEAYGITAYSRSLTTVEAIHRRIKKLLQHRRAVVSKSLLPTVNVSLIELKLESEGPFLFDDEKKVWYQEKTYRAWGRDDKLY